MTPTYLGVSDLFHTHRLIAPVQYVRHMGHIGSTAFRLPVSANLRFLLSFVSVCLWGESVGEDNQAAAIPQDFSNSHVMGIKLI